MSGMTGGTTGTQIRTICCLLIQERTNSFLLLPSVNYEGCVSKSNKKTNKNMNIPHVTPIPIISL